MWVDWDLHSVRCGPGSLRARHTHQWACCAHAARVPAARHPPLASASAPRYHPASRASAGRAHTQPQPVASMSKLDEQIVVAPRAQLFAEDESLAFHGFLPLSDRRAPAILQGLAEGAALARRGDVEDDPALLQPIPYVVLARAGAVGTELFAYTRLVGGGERRLHGKTSIGVGGHMNDLFSAATLREVVALEAGRELAEELDFRDAASRTAPPPPIRLLGLINDDTGPVQRVHIGLLAIADVRGDLRVSVRETERLEGDWVAIDALAARPALEEWSLHALEGLRAER